MSNEEQYIVTCRFPAWERESFTGGKTKFPAFGVKYLITTPICPSPDWPDDDERWLSYDETDEIEAEFRRQFEATIRHEFDGEILFVESSRLVLLKATATPERLKGGQDEQ